MKQYFSEKNFVIVLFVAALVIFSFAQEDTKKIERRLLDMSHSIPKPVDSPAALANSHDTADSADLSRSN